MSVGLDWGAKSINMVLKFIASRLSVSALHSSQKEKVVFNLHISFAGSILISYVDKHIRFSCQHTAEEFGSNKQSSSNDTALVLDLLAPWVHKTRQPSKYYKYSFFCMRASGGFPKFLIQQSEHKTDFWIRHPWGITADTYSGRHVKWTKIWVSNGPSTWSWLLSKWYQALGMTFTICLTI